LVRQLTPEEYRSTLGLFATGVTIVTTCHEDMLHGMTANAFASVSIDPFLVLVCVDREAGLHSLLPETGTFAVTVLSAEQQQESIWFASPDRHEGPDQFTDVDWKPAPVSGCPILTRGVAYLDCRVTEVHAGGDHSIFLGEVVDLGTLDGRDPLLFFGGGYRSLAPQ
jgi:flavin reductase